MSEIWRYNEQNGMYEYVFDNWADGKVHQTVMMAAKLTYHDGAGKIYIPDTSCVNLYRIFNGAMTMGQLLADVDEDDICYMHICDLGEFIDEMKSLRDILEPNHR